VKLTVQFNVCPAAKLNGYEWEVSLNPVPLTVAPEMVKVVVPVFFSCTVCEYVEPTGAFPKLTLLGVAVSPGVLTLAPVPENG
jgi:hypothetical protein